MPSGAGAGSAGWQPTVSPTGSRQVVENSAPSAKGDIPQVANLRNGRLPVCATFPVPTYFGVLVKRIVLLLLVTALVAIAGIGCNTAHGFGKDMQKAGEGIQDGTK